MKLARLGIAALACTLAIAAHAHGFLEKSDPRVGSTVHAAPTELRLWFSEPLEPAFSSVQVTDAQGQHVEEGRSQVDKKERGLMRVALKKLGAGSYTATWRIVSLDTHVTQGHFVFHVAP